MSTEAESRYKAKQDLDAIDELKRNASFKNYFLRRFDEELLKQLEKVMTYYFKDPAELLIEQRNYQKMQDLRRFIETDETSCRSILELNREERL